jgi:endonuclease G
MKKSNVVIIGILLFAIVIFGWFKPPSNAENKIEPAYTETQNEEEQVIILSDVEDTFKIQEKLDYSQLELPTFSKSDAIVRHFAYTLCYNEKYEQASWVAYQLTSEETIKRYNRTDRFLEDQQVKTGSATDYDYKRSGYDRGHLAPAADMGWSSTTMAESFYYSNMSPQEPSFNRGIWKKLEEQVRTWAMDYQAVYVVTGPVLKGNLSVIGANQVAVPNYYFKVLLDTKSTPKKAIGFILKNEGSKGQLIEYAVSIDSVERFTGIDFFPGLEDGLEQKLEASFCGSCWTWSSRRSSTVSNGNSSGITAVQCAGITKKGLRCRRMTKDASGFCYQHD